MEPATLVAAAESGDLATVERCLRQGDDVDARGAYGKSALALAVAGGHLTVAQRLLAAGADAAAADQWQRTALFYATSPAAARVLLQGGAPANHRDEHGKSALSWHAFFGPDDVAGEIVAAGAALDIRDAHGKTPLMLACEASRPGVVVVLLEAGARVNLRDTTGRTALFAAAEFDGAGSIERLLARGGQLNAKDRLGNTALMLACSRGRELAVIALLIGGASIDGAEACARGRPEILQLLREAPAQHSDLPSPTVALLLSAAHGDTDGVRAALADGAKPSVRDPLGRTPLRLAIAGDHFEVAALIEAAEIEGTRRLLRKQKDLLRAAVLGDVDGLVTALGAGAAADTRGAHTNSALELAAEYGRLEVLRALLDFGADPNAPSTCPALHWATRRGHRDVVARLLRAGSDVDARDPWGSTALINAATLRDDDLVKRLLLAGARTDLRRHDGGDAIAATREDSETRRLIEEAKRGRLAETERLRGTAHDPADCPICRMLPSHVYADVMAGERMPDAADQLERHADGTRRCPVCSTRYRFERDAGWYVTGSEETETLIRLDPEGEREAD